MFKKIGINAELQSTDWGSVVQRRATREPVEKGGWSVFHTWFTGGFTLNPVVSAPFRGLGAAGWFGWYENPKIEQLTQEWLDAKDEDARKKIAAAIQLENYAQVPTVTLAPLTGRERCRVFHSGDHELSRRRPNHSAGTTVMIPPVIISRTHEFR